MDLAPGQECAVSFDFTLKAPDGYIFVENDQGGFDLELIETDKKRQEDNKVV